MTFALFFILFILQLSPSFVHSSETFLVGNTEYLLDNDKCSDDCLKTIGEQTKIYFPTTPFRHFSPDDLKIFCPNVYMPNKPCLDQCPLNNTALTDRLLLQLQCVDNYQGFVNDKACIDNVVTNLKDNCSFCRKNTYDGVGLLAYTCKEANCETKCFAPYLVANCGESAVKFFETISMYGLKISNQAAIIIAGKPQDLPEECKTIIQDILI